MEVELLLVVLSRESLKKSLKRLKILQESYEIGTCSSFQSYS